MWREILRFAAPYAIAASVGFGAAWWVQGIRIDAAKNDTAEVQNAFLTYHNEQERLALEKEREQIRRQETTRKEWKEKLDALNNDHEVYRRCVAAGRCGGMRAMPAATCGDGVRLSATGGVDGSGGGAVPAAGEPAPQVVIDCAKVQLKLNALQSDIERQRGYQKRDSYE